MKRGPEGLSLFKITPEKACSFFAPRGARCQVTIYFRSGLTLVLNRVYNYDRGPPHPNRAAASGRLQEVGLDSPCWQPGVEIIQSAPFLSKFTPQKHNFVFVNRLQCVM